VIVGVENAILENDRQKAVEPAVIAETRRKDPFRDRSELWV